MNIVRKACEIPVRNRTEVCNTTPEWIREG